MSEKCSKPVGKGAVMFACGVEKDHDGPCAAVEIPSSEIARHKWEAEHPKTTSLKPEIVQSSVLPNGGFNSHEDRLTEARASLQGEFTSLPQAIQSWVNGAVAQLALVELWEAWKRASQAGAVELVLSSDEINLLIPEKLKLRT